ncbi:hypothetical protein VTN77DRAFT_5547 [Rasamsonia byssochlamydoides]|uniref:uncharacterized protein n=1 Tax=Rasamsonia byssochlamydoides TaxID=89139 RepID=UPI0037423C5A
MLILHNEIFFFHSHPLYQSFHEWLQTLGSIPKLPRTQFLSLVCHVSGNCNSVFSSKCFIDEPRLGRARHKELYNTQGKRGHDGDDDEKSSVQPIVLRKRHFRKVAQASNEFDKYLKDVYGGQSISQRAFEANRRYDDYGRIHHPSNPFVSSPAPIHNYRTPYIPTDRPLTKQKFSKSNGSRKKVEPLFRDGEDSEDSSRSLGFNSDERSSSNPDSSESGAEDTDNAEGEDSGKETEEEKKKTEKKKTGDRKKKDETAKGRKSSKKSK